MASARSPRWATNLAATFADGLRDGDRLYLPDPVYQGGTVDKSRGSDWLAEAISAKGGEARHLPTARRSRRIARRRRPGDRIVIMGARDDTLSDFAAELVQRL